ncbi:hypothetical protein C2845_PM03G26230 [Panicum miliaceum]|uniref:Reverse transcriptase domain-containing protein n=1 Tax=Panicum miliaceum TaxID=4540 RepID=A0A3L6TCF9_PANMI|nr:hypothetical protein C2845_PM03G26230 [Panicum miliaceum]
MWEREDSLEAEIEMAWKESGQKTCLGSISKSLHEVMRALKGWSKEKFSSIRKELEELRKKLAEMQSVNDEESNVQVKNTINRMNEILYREEMMWLQRSRISWLQEGDRNTKFFHQKAQWRARKNKIKGLRNDDGFWCTEPQEMASMAKMFFENLYERDDQVLPDEMVQLFEQKVSAEMNEALCKDFSEEEIAYAMFQIGPLKAPSPDGFPARFFQRNWGLMKEDIVRAVQEFFRTGDMPQGVNDTAIVLIPKSLHPEKLSEFRPISLCNVIYKVVSKCLVNRMRPLLQDLISPNQSAFVPGRLITDNAIIAFECIHAIQQSSLERNNFCVYKLDLSKGYDRVDWSLLEKVLLKMGFHSTWVRWVMSCVSTVRYSIRLNGVQLEPFSPTCGLRQGDPLSPYLFLFVADAISVALRKEIQEGQLEELKITRRAPGVSHLLFADDALVFFKATADQASWVKELLHRFEKCTGQKLSPAKCSLLTRENIDEECREQIRLILGVENVNFEPKYLGLPAPDDRQKRERFQPFRERFGKRVPAWSEKLLSAAGKEVLIKAVAQAIPTYIMSVFQMTKTFCEDLACGVRNYWWGDGDGVRKTHWMAWDKFTRSKSKGGLGFRDFEVFNQALLSRQAWRLLEFPESLYARLMKAVYYPNGDLCNTAFPTHVSLVWRSIMFGLELLKKGVIWRIGNGEKIKIWQRNWIPRGVSLKPAGKRSSCRLKWVSQLIDINTKGWDAEVLKRYFFDHDVEEITKIKIPWSPMEDTIAWHYEKTGCFTVRSAYRLAMQLRDLEGGMPGSSSRPDGARPIWKKLWTLPIPQKVKIFAWRLIHKGLATRANKQARRLDELNICEVCGREEEDEHHAVIRCNLATSLRAEMRKVWLLPEEEKLINTGPEWLLELINNLDGQSAGRLLLLFWRSWFAMK